jgi:hypothetical protein
MRTSVPGVATGLAWTPTGGDILFIEATRVPGRGKLILTGQLGDVMKESAQAALTLVKARAPDLLIDLSVFEKSDVHIHVPAGAIPKDGPSAGVAMFMALVSMLTGRTTRNDTAMTGEISLRGLVLPIGGVKEKVLAAVRAGIITVMLPARNRKDLEDVPDAAREQPSGSYGLSGRRRSRRGPRAGGGKAQRDNQCHPHLPPRNERHVGLMRQACRANEAQKIDVRQRGRPRHRVISANASQSRGGKVDEYIRRGDRAGQSTRGRRRLSLTRGVRSGGGGPAAGGVRQSGHRHPGRCRCGTAEAARALHCRRGPGRCATRAAAGLHGA